MASHVKPVKILRASAGSGKTFTLTAYYLDLLFSSTKSTKFMEILAVTFTNKATEEMKSRILSELKRLALDDPRSPYRDSILEQNPQYNSQTLAEKARTVYRRILHDYSRFSIMTIDSFGQKVIRSFASELGLEPGFKVDINTSKVKRDLVQSLDEELNTNQVLLDYCISMVIERLDRNKSWSYKKELIELADYLFNDDYWILEKSLEDILQRDSPDQVFKQYKLLTETTLSDFLNPLQVIFQEIIEIKKAQIIDPGIFKGKSKSPFTNLESNFGGELESLDQTKFLALLKKLDNKEEWFSKGEEIPGFYEEVNPLLKNLQTLYDQGYSKYCLAKSVQKKQSLLRLLMELNRILKNYRLESGDLLISDTQKLLQGITNPDSETPSFIWEKIGNTYKNFLLDEFQDTSRIQWSNFRPLIHESISNTSFERVKNLIVGDVKQSIYRWRNGDYSLLYQDAQRDLGSEYVEWQSLEINYRSRRNIIQFNNALFKIIPDLIQNSLNNRIVELENPEIQTWWEDQGMNQIIPDIYREAVQKEPKESLLGGMVKMGFIGDSDDSNIEDGEEERFKAKLIQFTLEEMEALLNMEGYVYSDFCILVRTNEEVKLALKALLNRNIPVVSGDALVLGNQKVIEIIILVFRYILGPKPQSEGYLYPLIILWTEWEKRPFPGESLIKGQNKDLDLPSGFLSRVEEWKGLPLSELFEQVLETFHLGNDAENIPYLLGFRDFLASFGENGEEGISRFLNWWDEDGKNNGLSYGNIPNAVQISTIHKSKGLAYRAVFLPFASWSMKGFPNREFWISTRGTDYSDFTKMPVSFNAQLEYTPAVREYFKELLDSHLDALNELYVALTRARDYIFISQKGKNNPKGNDIGDFVFLALSQLGMQKEDRDPNTFYTYGEVAGIKNKEPDNSLQERVLSLNHYPITPRLRDTIEIQSLDTKNRFKADYGSKWGTLLHDILSRVEGLEDLDPVLRDFRMRGLFFRQDEMEIRQEILSILHHPELILLFKDAGRVFNERTLMVPGMGLFRPDKVIFKEKETCILDYKFTQSVQTEHTHQVRKYAEILASLNYPGIRTYLYYHFNRSLLEV